MTPDTMRPALLAAQQCFNGQPVKIMEGGVCKGNHTIRILQEWPEAFLYLVDSYITRPIKFYFNTKARLAKYQKRIKWILEDQADAAKQFPDEFFDVTYMDFTCKASIRCYYLDCWWPKLKSGGFMGGKNYLHREVDKDGNHKETNKPMIDQFAEERKTEVHCNLEVKNTDWWIIKP